MASRFRAPKCFLAEGNPSPLGQAGQAGPAGVTQTWVLVNETMDLPIPGGPYTAQTLHLSVLEAL